LHLLPTMKKRKVAPPTLTWNDEYKAAVCARAYFGKKGYTIPKVALDPSDLEHLRRDLTVEPVIHFQPGSSSSGSTDALAFPVYRENANKIYVPRFYGMERYGVPRAVSQESAAVGEDIDVPFPNTLRDYQVPIVNVFLNHVEEHRNDTCCGGILEVPCARGKCLGVNTPILMYDGSCKLVQDILVGDVLMGDDSTPRRVLTLARGRERMYKVCDRKRGEGYVVNESHILSLKSKSTGTILDISVQEYLSYNDDCASSLLGYRVPVDFAEQNVDEDPYWVGKTIPNDVILPVAYKCNTHWVRLQVLQGMLDAPVFKLHRRRLDDVLFLARSLGFDAYPTDNGGVLRNHAPDLTYPIELIPMGVDEYYGFEIDGNRRFVLGDFTVTHNTVMALNIISTLKKKTLILVHKEFLMNQWIERIQEFLPTARIGKIQASTFDIDNKDIVLGMIQTMFSRTFDPDALDSFGFTVVDEVHRIGSEQFSKTLLKTMTPIMLGISATVDRKDDLTRVLYWFIGPKIYEERTRSEDAVCVKAITYVSTDPEFNEVEYDFRGQPKYATMLTKLARFGPRSDFVVRILQDLIQDHPQAQIMVLAHARALLTYLYEAITHRGFATTGFYVGGMKQAQLQATESKQIVLATYAMAAEALDIKTLSILVMVTPKTDIVQSVGRILRVKHAQPIVVDVLDGHDLFQNQWRQRKRYYRKCNYRIEQTDSTQYPRGWITTFSPKGGGGPKDDDEEPPAKCLVRWTGTAEEEASED